MGVPHTGVYTLAAQLSESLMKGRYWLEDFGEGVFQAIMTWVSERFISEPWKESKFGGKKVSPSQRHYGCVLAMNAMSGEGVGWLVMLCPLEVLWPKKAPLRGMTGYGPDVSGINGNLDFRVAHGNSWAGGGGQKRAQPVSWPKLRWDSSKWCNLWG